MTLKKLAAGSGYEYLTRQVAALDSTEKGRVSLADYYSATGEAPGRWTGRGLGGIDGIDVGDVVTAEQMKNLFGAGRHPVTGAPLGTAYKVYANAVTDAFNAKVDEPLSAIPRPTSAQRAAARAVAAQQFFVAEHGRRPATAKELSAALKRYSQPRRTAVAGFDLTFSPVKSVSALWAVAPLEIGRVIEQAHAAAVADTLSFIEDHVLFTREGKDGARQVETRGLLAAAFTHRDSRSGDPDLHTHVAIANKVQTRQGKWLSIYGSVLHQHVVAASETYNTALEEHLVARLGVRFADRPGGDREKRPVREIVGVDPTLCEAWSRRRADIVRRSRELGDEFRSAHGRAPTPVESVALAQQANLETRDAKHEPRSLGEQRATWRKQAAQVLGATGEIEAMVAAALHPATEADPVRISSGWVRERAARVIEELELHRATWQSWHIRAEVQRQVRGHDIPPEHLPEIVGWVLDAVTARSVHLIPDLDPVQEPLALQRSDGTSVYCHTGRDRYSSTRILAAEQRILTAAGLEGAAIRTTDDVEVGILAVGLDGITLNDGQRRLVTDLATSRRAVQLALAPAGTGKTTAMRALAMVWTEAGGSVLGLAPSAAAAHALGDATGMRCETLAKLINDLDQAPDSTWVDAIRPGSLLVIDEAGMADTLSLDRLIGFAIERGAVVRLIGDDQQLAAVGAGGVLRDIARTQGAVRLDEVVRFADPIEADASLALREGDPAALGYYLDHERVHTGDRDECLEEVFEAWQRERAQGRDCVMLAPTHDLVRDLNERARAARLAGSRPGPEVRLHDGTQVSVGDVVLTRRNDRRLAASATDWVKNGDRWTVTALRDGTLTVRHQESGLAAVLPAEYVAAHVELGYASTVHAAQGVTADVMHGVVTGEESRQLLYTMLTRGRDANHVHVVGTADLDDADQLPLPGLVEQLTAAAVLERIIARDGAAASATSTRHDAATVETRLREAAVRYADALDYVRERVVPAGDEPDAPGPLPWLPPIPPEVAEHPRWGPYLAARERLVRDLAHQVRQGACDTLPDWVQRYGDVLSADLRGEIAVWRAVTGIAPDERSLAGPEPYDDSAGLYRRRLLRTVNERQPEGVRGWEQRIIDCVGRADEQTLDLARALHQWQRRGYHPERLLADVADRPLPAEHPTAALAYRLNRAFRQQRAAGRQRGYQPEIRRDPVRQAPGPGLGL